MTSQLLWCWVHCLWFSCFYSKPGTVQFFLPASLHKNNLFAVLGYTLLHWELRLVDYTKLLLHLHRAWRCHIPFVIKHGQTAFGFMLSEFEKAWTLGWKVSLLPNEGTLRLVREIYKSWDQPRSKNVARTMPVPIETPSLCFSRSPT